MKIIKSTPLRNKMSDGRLNGLIMSYNNGGIYRNLDLCKTKEDFRKEDLCHCLGLLNCIKACYQYVFRFYFYLNMFRIIKSIYVCRLL